MFNTRRMAVIAVFVALATVLNIVERSVLVPGLPRVLNQAWPM